MSTIWWTLCGFLLGAIPVAPLVGRYAMGVDIRCYGDKNPGATNVLRAGSRVWFLVALILDVAKGALPVGLAYHQFGIQDWQAIPIALAPTLGHAFSPFLYGRGGKAMASMLGVWIGLTLWQIPLISLALLLFWFALCDNSGWVVLLTALGIICTILFWLPQPVFLAVALAQTTLILWKHRVELRQPPQLRWIVSC